MIKGTPSPWLNMPLEQLKAMKDRYKLTNDMSEQKNREKKLQQQQLDDNGQTQVEAMKERLPFLET